MAGTMLGDTSMNRAGSSGPPTAPIAGPSSLAAPVLRTLGRAASTMPQEAPKRGWARLSAAPAPAKVDAKPKKAAGG